MVLLIQVPLKKQAAADARNRVRKAASPAGAKSSEGTRMFKAKSDVEDAVVSHGKVQGPFTEVAGLAIERDERYPVRATVQFYKGTSNGVVSERDLELIAKSIDRVYKDADYVGSLVTEGYTGRPTESDVTRPITIINYSRCGTIAAPLKNIRLSVSVTPAAKNR